MELVELRALSKAFPSMPIAAEEEDTARPCPNDPGVPGLQGASMGAGQSPHSSQLKPTDSSLGQNTAITQPAQLTAAALQQRPTKMFVAGSGHPVESGEGAAVAKATNGLVKIAVKVIEDGGGILDTPALQRKPILGYSLDDEEALGYLLGDSVDYPLESDGARKVSKRASKHLKEHIKPQLNAVASTARKAAQKAGTCPDQAAEDARAAYLREPFDLKCHLHPRRQPAMQPSRERKRKAIEIEKWHHEFDGQCMPWEVVVNAAKAQDQAIIKAMKATEEAEVKLASAHSKLKRAEAVLDQEKSLADHLRLCPSVSARILEQEDRAWATYNAAWRAYEDADAAHDAAIAAQEHENELHDRMERWVDRPERLTPFPWPGEEFIEPCNQRDLDYYTGRPDAYPPGMHAWHLRFHKYLYEGPCVCVNDYDMCTICCPPSPRPPAPPENLADS